MQKMLVSINNFLSKEEIESFLNKKTSIDLIVDKASSIISKCNNAKVYTQWVEFLTMKPGSFNSLHTDIDNDEENLISAILYLNNDYNGGEFIFQNIKVKPNSGQLLFFNSNKNTPHEVTEVLGADRLSISMFFSYDETRSKYKYLSKTISNTYKRDKRPI